MKQWEDIDAEELLRLLANGLVKADQIIDVRELQEWDYYHLEGSRHLPMSVFPDLMASLSQEDTLYIMCAHGVRSQAVCRYMQENGYEALLNVEGGIAAVAARQGFQYD
ncbi:rhodanese-like domain-containing protein [Paenibacillus kobensis]|uniref:rhodanese-like domain-containing protein n=1 Tax=Paenibacillus kobensis TaxID=59841 RepID=UPI000FD6C2CC|nr:rhodanese-like domain-containing protein [Paenibacillus kobensis]